MNVLLDTHAAIWFITDDSQLPKHAKKIIEHHQNRCFVSIATLWEMGIKYSLGKLELKAELKKIFELFHESGFHILPISTDHVLTISTMSFHHRDPFDRLIIAQALREGFTLISRDELFNKYDVNLIWNE